MRRLWPILMLIASITYVGVSLYSHPEYRPPLWLAVSLVAVAALIGTAAGLIAVAFARRARDRQ